MAAVGGLEQGHLCREAGLMPQPRGRSCWESGSSLVFLAVTSGISAGTAGFALVQIQEGAEEAAGTVLETAQSNIRGRFQDSSDASGPVVVLHVVDRA